MALKISLYRSTVSASPSSGVMAGAIAFLIATTSNPYSRNSRRCDSTQRLADMPPRERALAVSRAKQDYFAGFLLLSVFS